MFAELMFVNYLGVPGKAFKNYHFQNGGVHPHHELRNGTQYVISEF